MGNALSRSSITNVTDCRTSEVGAPCAVIAPTLQPDSAAVMATMMMEMPVMMPITTVLEEQMSQVPMHVAEVSAEAPVNSTEEAVSMEAPARYYRHPIFPPDRIEKPATWALQ